MLLGLVQSVFVETLVFTGVSTFLNHLQGLILILNIFSTVPNFKMYKKMFDFFISDHESWSTTKYYVCFTKYSVCFITYFIYVEKYT